MKVQKNNNKKSFKNISSTKKNNKKINKLKVIMVTLPLLFLITFIILNILNVKINFNFNIFKNMDNTKVLENEANNVIKNENVESSTIPGIGIKKDEYINQKYTMYMSYPTFNFKELEDEITSYLNNEKEIFLKTYEENIKNTNEYKLNNNNNSNSNSNNNNISNNEEENDIPLIKIGEEEDKSTLNISFEIENIEEDIYSIIFRSERLLKFSNLEEKTKIYIINSKTGKLLSAKEYFDENKTDELVQIIKDKLTKEYNNSLFEEQYDELFKNENRDNIYKYIALTKEKVIVQFSKYEITSGNAGSVRIEFTLEELNNILKEEVLEKLMIPLPEEKEEKIEVKEEKVQKVTGKKVALTFDDGPHSKNTKEILDLLDKYNAKATFFVLGTQVGFYENILKDVYNRGHQIGNHTWSHKDLKKLGNSEIKEQITKTDNAIKKAIGIIPKIYRPPYGSHNSSVDKVTGKKVVMWDVDTLDWKNKSPQKMLEIVKKEVKNNSIILLHDIHTPTVEGVRLILEYLKSEGYLFVRVDQLD